MKTCYRSPLVFAIAFLLLVSGTALAQGSGTIQGTVSDPTGAVIPQASVTARNIATGVETARQTNAAGLYVLAPLPPGDYTIRATATGFQTLTQEHLVVEALATIGLNLELKVGSAAEQINVEAVATTLRTEDVATASTLICSAAD